MSYQRICHEAVTVFIPVVIAGDKILGIKMLGVVAVKKNREKIDKIDIVSYTEISPKQLLN